MTHVLQGRETKPNKWLSSINAAGLHNGKAERTNMVKMELKPQVEDEQEMGRRQNAKDREFTHSFLRYYLSAPCGQVLLWTLRVQEWMKQTLTLTGMLSHSVVSDSLQPHGLWPTKILYPWDSPGKNTGVGCYSSSRGSSRPSNQTCISCSVSQSVPSLSHVWLFLTPWTAATQASLSITKSWSLLKFMSIEAVMPSNHLILCRPLLLPHSIFPSIRVSSNESVLCIKWPKYWSFRFSISPSNEYLGLISFRMDWLDLLAVQGTLKSLLQHHSSKASILWHSAFFTVQLSHPYMTTGNLT